MSRERTRVYRHVSAARTGRTGGLVGEVDAGQPEARGVELGRRRQLPLGLPEAGQPGLAGAFDDAPDEGRALLVLAPAELEAQESGRKALAIGGLHPPPAQGLGELAVG